MANLRVRASRRASASSCAMRASARRLSVVSTSRLADTCRTQQALTA